MSLFGLTPTALDLTGGVWHGETTTGRCDTAQYIVKNGTGGCVFNQVVGVLEYTYNSATRNACRAWPIRV